MVVPQSHNQHTESLGCKRSSQSILEETSPECSLEGLMLGLMLQYSGHLMGRADSLEKNLVLGKTEGERRRGQQDEMINMIADSMDMNLSKPRETGEDRGVWPRCSPWGCKASGTT